MTLACTIACGFFAVRVKAPVRSRHAPRAWPGARHGMRLVQLVQAVPLTEKLVGLASLLAQLPWKPSVMLAPGAMVPL